MPASSYVLQRSLLQLVPATQREMCMEFFALRAYRAVEGLINLISCVKHILTLAGVACNSLGKLKMTIRPSMKAALRLSQAYMHPSTNISNIYVCRYAESL